MHATIRRYEGRHRTDRRAEPQGHRDPRPAAGEARGLPRLLPGRVGNGVFTSVGLFASPAQSDEATTIASAWVKEEKLESALPNAPRITSGKVIAQQDGIAVA